ncbi:Thymus-specific serine protease [Perkinsus chesapeaki]|uniref:Thymus-specific serine protease n=1 Tax=Perkinsus chesapeaki TaxID=330153 RepID=A0A7J6N0D7_PERCH|nr:Thymus-specific serine protease [Perkinsus chesapeaki]
MAALRRLSQAFQVFNRAEGTEEARDSRGDERAGEKNISLDETTAADVKIQRGGRRFSQVQVANRRAIMPTVRSSGISAMLSSSTTSDGNKNLRSRNIRGSVAAELAQRVAAARVVAGTEEDRPASGGFARQFFNPTQSNSFNMKMVRIIGTVLVLCIMTGSGLVISTNLHYTATAERQRDIFLRDGLAPRITAEIQAWLETAMQVRDAIHWSILKQIYTEEFDYGMIRRLVEPFFGRVEGLMSIELAFSNSPHIVRAIEGADGKTKDILLQSDAPSCFSIGSLGCLQRSEAFDAHSTAWYEIGSSLNESDVLSSSVEAATLWAGPTIRPDNENQFLIPVYTMIWKSTFPGVVGEPFLVGRATIDVRDLSTLLLDKTLVEGGIDRVYLTTREGTVVAARQSLSSYVSFSDEDRTIGLKRVWELYAWLNYVVTLHAPSARVPAGLQSLVSSHLKQLTEYDYSDVYQSANDGAAVPQLVTLSSGACVIHPFPSTSSTGIAFALVAFSEVDPFVDPTMAGLLVSCVLLFLQVSGFSPILGIPLIEMEDAADRMGAIMIMLQQRYSGGSMPTNEFSVATLKKLFTVPQSVQDVAFFGAQIKSATPEMKIILFGCSKGGTIAALARKYYPHIFDGAIVSSATLKFQLENEKYAEVVNKDFSNSDLGGSRSCLKAVSEGCPFSYWGELGSQEGRRELEEKFGLSEGDLETPETQTSLTYYDGATGAMLQSNDPLCEKDYCNIKKICAKLTKGKESLLDKLATIYKTHRPPPTHFVENLRRLILQLKDDKSSDYNRLGEFHVCSTRGLMASCKQATCPFFTREGYDWMDFSLWKCKEGFGISKEEVLEGVTELQKYVGDFRTTTNVLSINGDADPWYPSSISQEGEGPEAEMESLQEGTQNYREVAQMSRQIPLPVPQPVLTRSLL